MIDYNNDYFIIFVVPNFTKYLYFIFKIILRYLLSDSINLICPDTKVTKNLFMYWKYQKDLLSFSTLI
jgi:hypothetical protein